MQAGHSRLEKPLANQHSVHLESLDLPLTKAHDWEIPLGVALCYPKEVQGEVLALKEEVLCENHN